MKHLALLLGFIPATPVLADAKCAKKYALNARCTGKRNVINQPRQPAA